MLPPRDGLALLAGAFPAMLYMIIGNIYGLANAPAIWCDEVRKRLYSVGFVSSTLDVMFFLCRNSVGCLIAAIIVHVDDFFVIYNQYEFDIFIVKNLFSWGSIREWSKEAGFDNVVFLAKQLTVFTRQGERAIRIHHEDYIASTPVRRVSKARREDPASLNGSEVTEMLSCIGSLQYLSSSLRMDLAAGVSLCQRKSPTAQDLADLMEQLNWARETKEMGLVFRGHDLARSAVYSYGDSSYANAPDLKSQTGLICCIGDTRALTGESPCCAVDHRSARTTRVCRSTLAAEAASADDAVDHGLYTAYHWSEMLNGTKATAKPTRAPSVNLYSVTDCKSLYDAVTKENSSCTEKRTLISLCSIREAVSSRMRWAPTHLQHADGLTKTDKSLRQRFLHWMQWPYARLHD